MDAVGSFKVMVRQFGISELKVRPESLILLVLPLSRQHKWIYYVMAVNSAISVGLLLSYIKLWLRRGLGRCSGPF